MRPEVAAILEDRSSEGEFAAIEVARNLNRELLEKGAVVDYPGELDARERETLDKDLAVGLSLLAIEIAARQPTLEPSLLKAIQQQKSSKAQSGAASMWLGIALNLSVRVARLKIKASSAGKWEIQIDPLADSTIVTLAKQYADRMKKLIP